MSDPYGEDAAMSERRTNRPGVVLLIIGILAAIACVAFGIWAIWTQNHDLQGRLGGTAGVCGGIAFVTLVGALGVFLE